jgi:Histidine kinase-, DNA gyrase B-, and HSP90-like ATPase
VTHPRPTAPDDYSPHTIKDNKYLPPASAGAGQPDSAGGQSGGGHHRFRRRGPVSRLLHRGQPAGAAAGTPTGAAAGTPTGTVAGTPTGAVERAGAQSTRKGSALPADGSSPAAAGPATTGVSGDSGDSGYRPQQRTSRSEQSGISSASAPPAPGQRGIEEVNERLDPEQAAREYLAGCRLDEARGPGVPRDGDRAGRDTSPMPPFPGSARSRAAVPAPFADWVAGRADGPGRPVNATGSFPGRPVPPMPAGSIPSAPSFVMPAPTFASCTASSAAPPTGSSAVSGPAAPPPGQDGNPLYRVLAGLALRNLTLVETQLQVMEKLEGHEEDAEQLKLLFRIDHLATRMRRNSENLLVLAGHDDTSRDFEPVPLLDVVRAAISEITEYSRAQIASLPDVQVAGRPADDVSHILAELLDNATSKSPQSAVVVVRAERTGDGTLVLTVEDSGIGIPTDQLADINTRLGRPPVLEAATTRHIGLYVVGRLAERHGLRVQLRERPYGGIAAHVILPRDLFHDRPEPTERNGRGAAAASPTRTGAGPVHDPGTEAGHEAASPVGVPAASADGGPADGPETSVPASIPAASADGGPADGPETSVPASIPAASADGGPADGPETSVPASAETDEG